MHKLSYVFQVVPLPTHVNQAGESDRIETHQERQASKSSAEKGGNSLSGQIKLKVVKKSANQME